MIDQSICNELKCELWVYMEWTKVNMKDGNNSWRWNLMNDNDNG